MNTKAFICITIFMILSFFGSSQECILNAGATDSEKLIEGLELSSVQKGYLKVWKIEFQMENKEVEKQIRKLLTEHPQKTTKNITEMGQKYHKLQQRITLASKGIDKKVLSILNKRQYVKYRELCTEVERRPLRVVPVQITETFIGDD